MEAPTTEPSVTPGQVEHVATLRQASPGVADPLPTSRVAPTVVPVNEASPLPVDQQASIARLDASLLDLAKRTRANEISRSAWVDRAMRAWDIAGTDLHGSE